MKNYNSINDSNTGSINKHFEQRRNTSRISGVAKIVFNIGCAIFLLILILIYNDSSAGSLENNRKESDIYSKTFSFTLTRENYPSLIYFDPSHTLPVQEWKRYYILDNVQAIIEPHAPMVLTIHNDTKSNYTYKLVACSTNNECGETTNNILTIGCSPYDEYSIELYAFEENGELFSITYAKALCIYVRREFRALTPTDLKSLMDAMYVLWATNETQGRALYGENYRDALFFSKCHFFNAGWYDGDHIHEGNGFVSQHIKITNDFEAAIQVVDPSVSLPYWDYTIESSSKMELYDSPYFTESTFGTLAKPKNGKYWSYADGDLITDARVPDGRWKDTTVSANEWYPEIVNGKLKHIHSNLFAKCFVYLISHISFDCLMSISGYGFMRAPWNFNPSPYLTRFYDTVTAPALPSCSSHLSILRETDYTDYSLTISYAAHGSTHTNIGNKFGCDVMLDVYEEFGFESEAKMYLWCNYYPLFMKDFYRMYFYRLDGPCVTIDEKSEAAVCKLICTEELTDEFGAKLKEYIEELDILEVTDTKLAYIKDWICNGDGTKLFFGDHLESASTHDPTFWSIHTTIERLTHAKFMVGGFETDDWPTNATADYVCDWVECYDRDMKLGNWDDCCLGHFLDDKLLNFVTGDRYGEGYGPTNKETLESIQPLSETYSASYIFDDFTWEHCADIGYDIEGFLSNTYIRSKS
jgi:hypothetical protein